MTHPSDHTFITSAVAWRSRLQSVSLLVDFAYIRTANSLYINSRCDSLSRYSMWHETWNISLRRLADSNACNTLCRQRKQPCISIMLRKLLEGRGVDAVSTEKNVSDVIIVRNARPRYSKYRLDLLIETRAALSIISKAIFVWINVCMVSPGDCSPWGDRLRHLIG